MAANINPSAYEKIQGYKDRLRRDLPPDILYCDGFPVRRAILLEWLAIAELEFTQFVVGRIERIRDERWAVRKRIFGEAVKGAKHDE